jgi:hypothetical protein
VHGDLSHDVTIALGHPRADRPVPKHECPDVTIRQMLRIAVLQVDSFCDLDESALVTSPALAHVHVRQELSRSSASSRFRTLPVSLRGSESRSTISRGTL